VGTTGVGRGQDPSGIKRMSLLCGPVFNPNRFGPQGFYPNPDCSRSKRARPKAFTEHDNHDTVGPRVASGLGPGAVVDAEVQRPLPERSIGGGAALEVMPRLRWSSACMSEEKEKGDDSSPCFLSPS
jgi:hypothetical protein